MSELNQNNRRLSRLAIISQHVAAHRREHFGTVWGDFWHIGSFFLGTCLFRLNATLHRTLCPSPSGLFMLFESQRCCVDFGVFLMLMEDALGLDELQMLLWRCLLHLTGDEDYLFQETQPTGAVPLDRLQGVCGPMCIVIKNIQRWRFGVNDSGSGAKLFSFLNPPWFLEG